MTDGLKDAHREAIVSVLAADDRVERAVLFGSRATGTNTVTSDVDVALFGDRLTLADRARLAAVIDEIPMAQSVELLLYDSVRDRALRDHIRKEGVEWYRRLNTSDTNPYLENEATDTTVTMERGVHSRQWSAVQLGEVVDLLTGFPFRSNEYVSDPEAPRLLRGANIAQGHLRWDDVKRWSPEAGDREHLTPYWLRKGDVVIAMDRPWIEAGLKSSSVRETDLPALLVQRVARLRGGDRLDTRFLSYVIGCQGFVHHVLSVQTGTAVPHISAQQIKEFEFFLPHVHEQRAIARILGTLDDKIESNRRMNETLEAMARALFKSWFVDFDPVRAKMDGRDTGLPQDITDLFPDRLVESEMGEIPEGWEVSTIGQEVDAVGGSTPSTKEPSYWSEGQHCWATPKDLSKLRSPVLLDTSRKITDAGLRRISSGTLPVGTVLMSSRAPIGYLAVAEVPTAVNQGFIAMRCERRLPNLYVLFWCYHNLGHIKDIAGGSTFPEISKKAFRPLSVLVPSKPILQAFGCLSHPLHDRLAENMKQASTLAALRDTLLPKLISGQINLQGVAA